MIEDVDIYFCDGPWRDDVPESHEPEHEARVADTVAAFLKCPKLRQLEINNGTEMEAAEPIEAIVVLCRRMRLKRKHSLYASILGIEYLL